MKPTEAAALLTIAAAYDNRKPDADQAKAWAMALDDARFEDCREAIVNHYRNSREWLMPVDVLKGVTAIRLERWNVYARRYGMLQPPAHLADDAAAENRWVSVVTNRIRDGLISSPDEIPAFEQLEAAVYPELGGAA